MTAETLAELLSDIEEAEKGHGSAGVDRYAVVLATADVRQVLDEREALLVAAKRVIATLGPDNADCDENVVPLAAAIAKAGAP